MPKSSNALAEWRGGSAAKLDELVAAHARVGGTGPGRRYATEQLNASLVLQVAAHFQLFCRDLHTETARELTLAAPVGYGLLVQVALTSPRLLDRGNARARVIGEDFRRFGLDIWTRAAAMDARSRSRRFRLEQLNAWRNAVAHQDFAFSAEQQRLLAGTSLTLRHVRDWRAACDGLARTFDRVVARHVQAITGRAPW